jgi:hypothetical protein
MVSGHGIDPKAVASFAVGAGIIIAHNATLIVNLNAIGRCSSTRHFRL